jgi:hypothetical protein
MLEHGEQGSLYRLSVEITNRSDSQMIVYVEPWGDEFELQPIESIRVDLLAPAFRAIPVSFGINSITIEGWEGSVSEVWKGEDRLN